MNQNYSPAPLDDSPDEDTGRAGAPAERGVEREERDPFLTAMGERVRLLRARRGMTRKTLARSIFTFQLLFDTLADGVEDGDLDLLDVSRVRRGDTAPDLRLDKSMMCSAAREGDDRYPSTPRCHGCFNKVGRPATRGDDHQHVTGIPQRLNLASKDELETIIVAYGCDGRQ